MSKINQREVNRLGTKYFTIMTKAILSEKAGPEAAAAAVAALGQTIVHLAWAMFEDKAYARDLIMISINAAIRERTKRQ
jgi:hypothetical protein